MRIQFELKKKSKKNTRIARHRGFLIDESSVKFSKVVIPILFSEGGKTRNGNYRQNSNLNTVLK